MAVNKDPKTGKWYFRVYVDDPITGRRIQKTKKGFELKRDALDSEAVFIAKYQNKEYVIDDIYVDDLIDEFLSFLKKKVKVTTYVGYEYQIQRHIKPFFTKIKLKNVNKLLLDNWYKYMNNQNYTHRYKNKMLVRLKSIFEYADDQYSYKVRYLYTLPNFKKKTDDYERNITIYTEDMFDKFISFAENEFEKTLFTTFYYTGARVSEIRALEWNDIDLITGIVKIRRQVTSKITGQPNRIITPKSESSNRDIFIPKILKDQLTIWKNDRMKLKGYKNDWRVFGDYSFISEQRIRRIANRLSQLAELPHIRLHDFRHSYSTLLHNKGVDPKIIQSQAGHSTVQITLDTYTHISMQQKKQTIADIFDNQKLNKKDNT